MNSFDDFLKVSANTDGMKLLSKLNATYIEIIKGLLKENNEMRVIENEKDKYFESRPFSLI